MMEDDDIMFPEEELPVEHKGVMAELTEQLKATARDMTKWVLAVLAALNAEGVVDREKAAAAKTLLTKTFHDCGASPGMTSYTKPDAERNALEILRFLGEAMTQVGENPYLRAAAANDLDHALFFAIRPARWAMTISVFYFLCMIESAASALELSDDDKIDLIQLRTTLSKQFPPYEEGPRPPLTWSMLNC